MAAVSRVVHVVLVLGHARGALQRRGVVAVAVDVHLVGRGSVDHLHLEAVVVQPVGAVLADVIGAGDLVPVLGVVAEDVGLDGDGRGGIVGDCLLYTSDAADE